MCSSTGTDAACTAHAGTVYTTWRWSWIKLPKRRMHSTTEAGAAYTSSNGTTLLKQALVKCIPRRGASVAKTVGARATELTAHHLGTQGNHAMNFRGVDLDHIKTNCKTDMAISRHTASANSFGTQRQKRSALHRNTQRCRK